MSFTAPFGNPSKVTRQLVILRNTKKRRWKSQRRKRKRSRTKKRRRKEQEECRSAGCPPIMSPSYPPALCDRFHLLTLPSSPPRPSFPAQFLLIRFAVSSSSTSTSHHLLQPPSLFHWISVASSASFSSSLTSSSSSTRSSAPDFTLFASYLSFELPPSRFLFFASCFPSFASLLSLDLIDTHVSFHVSRCPLPSSLLRGPMPFCFRTSCAIDHHDEEAQEVRNEKGIGPLATK